MRRLGQFLLGIGVAVGAAAALWIGVGVAQFGLSRLVGVAIVKLMIAAAR